MKYESKKRGPLTRNAPPMIPKRLPTPPRITTRKDWAKNPCPISGWIVTKGAMIAPANPANAGEGGC